MPANQPQENFLNLQVKELQGLLPAIDAKTSEKPYVIEGKNFWMDLKGPVSGFGSYYLTKAQLFDPELVKSFRTGDEEVVYCTADAVLKYDTDGMFFYPVYLFNPIVDYDWPWSHAEVSGRHYFCKRGVGVIKYYPPDSSWELLNDAAIPDDPVGVCQCRGRLVILGSDAWAWSALGTGDDLTPSLNTGAGNQGISIIGGTPLGVFELDDAFLVSTTKGFVISEFTGGGATPFRHRTLKTNDKAINPFCIISMGSGLVVFLDLKGLRSTSGKEPEVFQPLFSEFLSRTLIPGRNLRNATIFRLEYNDDRQWLFLSVASDGAPTKYDIAYVLYRPLTDKWGSFNEPHRSFVEIYVNSGPGVGFSFGFVDDLGYFHVFSEDIFRETTSFLSDPEGYFWQPDIDIPARISDGEYIMPSLLTIDTQDPSYFVTRQPNWYLFTEIGHHREVVIEDADLASELESGEYLMRAWFFGSAAQTEFGVAEFPTERSSLDSFVILGPFRFTELKYSDQLGHATNVTITVESIGEESEDEDWMDNPFDEEEDWGDMLEASEEDWGGVSTDRAMFDAIIRGTNDVRTVFGDNEETMELRLVDGDTYFYPCFATIGLYQTIEVNAQDLLESFHVTDIEISGTSAGRL